jgi:glycosyltransferase involved in cell wall biosynthesis
MEGPLVTVGIPAYNRPEGLRRALTSVAAQTYPNIEVLVSDDCSPDGDLGAVVAEFSSRIPNLSYRRQAHNLGLIRNAQGLVTQASGQYFMWLADDDEISANYIAALVEVLESDSTTVTAMGTWYRQLTPTTALRMPTSRFPQVDAVERARDYIRGSDDAFFYGVHRTATLRRATVTEFWWPNRGTYRNWCYPYLMDMVLLGRIRVADDPEVQWINHSYVDKLYDPTSNGWPWAIRRVNVQWEYLKKVRGRLGWTAMIRCSPTAAQSVIREVSPRAARRVARALGRKPHGRVAPEANAALTRQDGRS